MPGGYLDWRATVSPGASRPSADDLAGGLLGPLKRGTAAAMDPGFWQQMGRVMPQALANTAMDVTGLNAFRRAAAIYGAGGRPEDIDPSTMIGLGGAAGLLTRGFPGMTRPYIPGPRISPQPSSSASSANFRPMAPGPTPSGNQMGGLLRNPAGSSPTAVPPAPQAPVPPVPTPTPSDLWSLSMRLGAPRYAPGAPREFGLPSGSPIPPRAGADTLSGLTRWTPGARPTPDLSQATRAMNFKVLPDGTIANNHPDLNMPMLQNPDGTFARPLTQKELEEHFGNGSR
jgi:hypothetical protein